MQTIKRILKNAGGFATIPKNILFHKENKLLLSACFIQLILLMGQHPQRTLRIMPKLYIKKGIAMSVYLVFRKLRRPLVFSFLI